MSTEKVPDDAELAEPEEAQDEPDVTVMKKPSGKAKAKAKAVKAKAAPKKGLVKCKDEPKDDEKEDDDDDQPMKKPASKAPMKKPATPKGGGKAAQKAAAQKAAALKKAAAEAKKAEEKKKKEEKKRKREEEIARDWKSGLQADDDHQEGGRGEEEELDDDPCMDEDFGMAEREEKNQTGGKNKDRSKDYKFKAMYKSGQLPSWLAEEWEKASAMKSGRQERQREIVNNAIDRKADGRLLMNTDKPMFAELQATFTKNKSTEKEKSLPKSLFMGKFKLERRDLCSWIDGQRLPAGQKK
ncbi:unnamed protein product [Symbiodinium microadriaticum]|nr:unnamed protein product [Symbiodinium microadriaticum]